MAEPQGSLEQVAGQDLAHGVDEDAGAVIAERDTLCTGEMRFPVLEHVKKEILSRRAGEQARNIEREK